MDPLATRLSEETVEQCGGYMQNGGGNTTGAAAYKMISDTQADQSTAFKSDF
jgi:hypothetical protein